MKVRARIVRAGPSVYWWAIERNRRLVVSGDRNHKSVASALRNLRTVCAALGCEVPEIEEGT